MFLHDITILTFNTIQLFSPILQNIIIINIFTQFHNSQHSCTNSYSWAFLHAEQFYTISHSSAFFHNIIILNFFMQSSPFLHFHNPQKCYTISTSLTFLGILTQWEKNSFHIEKLKIVSLIKIFLPDHVNIKLISIKVTCWKIWHLIYLITKLMFCTLKCSY